MIIVSFEPSILFEGINGKSCWTAKFRSVADSNAPKCLTNLQTYYNIKYKLSFEMYHWIALCYLMLTLA